MGTSLAECTAMSMLPGEQRTLESPMSTGTYHSMLLSAVAGGRYLDRARRRADREPRARPTTKRACAQRQGRCRAFRFASESTLAFCGSLPDRSSDPQRRRRASCMRLVIVDAQPEQIAHQRHAGMDTVVAQLS